MADSDMIELVVDEDEFQMELDYDEKLRQERSARRPAATSAAKSPDGSSDGSTKPAEVVRMTPQIVIQESSRPIALSASSLNDRFTRIQCEVLKTKVVETFVPMDGLKRKLSQRSFYGSSVGLLKDKSISKARLDQELEQFAEERERKKLRVGQKAPDALNVHTLDMDIEDYMSKKGQPVEPDAVVCKLEPPADEDRCPPPSTCFDASRLGPPGPKSSIWSRISRRVGEMSCDELDRDLDAYLAQSSKKTARQI